MSCCEIGTHECEVPLKIGQKTIKVDKCLLNEIDYLVHNDIHTLGCCCGHGNRKKPYIEVDEKDRTKMLEKGYIELPLIWNGSKYEGYNCFMPRSNLEWQVVRIG